jgi:hypothetical protein
MKKITEEVEWIAGEIQSTAVRARITSQEIVSRMEELFRNESSCDSGAAEMPAYYQWKDGISCLWAPDEGEAGNGVVGATGAVPIDDAVKRELLLYERLRPFFRDAYARNPYSDEVLYIDKKSMVVGQTAKNFGNAFPPGFDAARVCASGITYYDYYGWVDAAQNPQRVPRWAPGPFIELLGCFIQAVHAPVYKRSDDPEMCGFAGVHYNLQWMNAATVDRSDKRVIIVSGGGTLVGASADALQAVRMDPFVEQKPSWQASREVRDYIDVGRNLEQGKPEDLAGLSRNIRARDRFEHTLYGRKFTVARRAVPELDFYVAALL